MCCHYLFVKKDSRQLTCENRFCFAHKSDVNKIHKRWSFTIFGNIWDVQSTMRIISLHCVLLVARIWNFWTTTEILSQTYQHHMQIWLCVRFFVLEVFFLLRHQVLVARDVHALPTCELLVPELVDQPHQTLQQKGCLRGLYANKKCQSWLWIVHQPCPALKKGH